MIVESFYITFYFHYQLLNLYTMRFVVVNHTIYKILLLYIWKTTLRLNIFKIV